MEQKIATLTKMVKERSLKSNDSMNVLIVSAKDDNEDLDSGDDARQVDDLENQDRANRSILGNSNSEKDKDTIKGRGGRILKKKTKKSKLTSKDGSSSASSLKYQLKENQRSSKKGSSRKMISSSQLQ